MNLLFVGLLIIYINNTTFHIIILKVGKNVIKEWWYNEKNNITPKSIVKDIRASIEVTKVEKEEINIAVERMYWEEELWKKLLLFFPLIALYIVTNKIIINLKKELLWLKHMLKFLE